MDVPIQVKITKPKAALCDELARRNGNTSRAAVLRKALDTLIDTELDAATVRRIQRQHRPEVAA